MNFIYRALLIIGTLHLAFGQENIRGNIPSYLIDCYRNENLYRRDFRYPSTMGNLITLIRKVELFAGANMDIRSLTCTLLHRFRVDGIERNPNVGFSDGVTPFRPSGRQFNKHKILFGQLIPGNGNLFPNESLSLQEQCALHFMLSSSVDQWERGDEQQVCPLTTNPGGIPSKHFLKYKQWIGHSFYEPRSSNAQISQCPVEEGVVSTQRWGTVSPGTLLAGIAAGLENQDVKLSDLLVEPTDAEKDSIDGLAERFSRYQMLSESDDGSINTIWAATLAGDLAEVAVWQGPRLQPQQQLTLGPSGLWNNTFVPRAFYMATNHDGLWEMTDAESRGGVDGLILGSQVKSWTEQLSRVKLSQLLEMYYSDRGVNFDETYRVCEREQKLREHVTPAQLLVQTSNFARVLSYQLGNVQLEDETLREFCEMAVIAARTHQDVIVSGPPCPGFTKPSPKVHLTVVLDGTWTPEDALSVLGYLAEEADVSHYGSSMSVINGKTGNVILQMTHNATDLFEYDSMYNMTWPTGMELWRALTTAHDLLSFEMAEERRNMKIGGDGHVVLVLGLTATIAEVDFARSKEKVADFHKDMPDIKLLFLSSELNRNLFEQLLLKSSVADDEVLISSANSAATVVPLIVKNLAQVPGRILGLPCYNGTSGSKYFFEDYILPEETKHYRIHPQFLSTDTVKVTFVGNDYGQLLVCLSRQFDDQLISNCSTELKAKEEISFEIVKPCEDIATCNPIFFRVIGQSSQTKCTEDECRFPHEIRFTLHHVGLRCITDVNTGALSSVTLPTLHRGIFTSSLIILVTLYFTIS